MTVLAHRHGCDINWGSVSRMMDNVAGMASQRDNHARFIAIVKSAMRSYDPEQTSGFWRQEGR